MLFAVERVGGAGGVVDAKCRYNRPPGAERGGQRRRKGEKSFSVYIFLVLP